MKPGRTAQIHRRVLEISILPPPLKVNVWLMRILQAKHDVASDAENPVILQHFCAQMGYVIPSNLGRRTER